MRILKKMLLLSALLCLSACFLNNSEKEVSKSSVFIQLILESKALHSAVESMKPLINAAIKEELGLDKEFDFEFFLTKPRYTLTLYYLNDMYENGQKGLFEALDEQAEDLKNFPQKVAFSDNLNFFGPTQDELVVVMDDSEGELKSLHGMIKKLVYEVDETYKASHKHNLFDLTKSERHAFLSHVTLGRIRYNSVKQHVKDSEQVDKVFARIKERTKKIVLSALEKLSEKEGRYVSFTTLVALDPRTSTSDGLATILKSW